MVLVFYIIIILQQRQYLSLRGNRFWPYLPVWILCSCADIRILVIKIYSFLVSCLNTFRMIICCLLYVDFCCLIYIYTRGYPKIRGFFKYLLNVNVYCNEILSVYILEYYEQILKTTLSASINNDFILILYKHIHDTRRTVEMRSWSSYNFLLKN